MKKFCRILYIILSNSRFYSFDEFRYRPKVMANSVLGLYQKGGFGRTLTQHSTAGVAKNSSLSYIAKKDFARILVDSTN